MGATKYLQLNDIGNSGASSTRWNNTAPTSSVFTVGTAAGTNQTGGAYVAYVFAHDDASFGTDGDESIIKCGTVDEVSSSKATVDLGFEPQFLLIKGDDTFTHWFMLDNMRQWGASGINSTWLRAEGNNAEDTQPASTAWEITNQGFKIPPIYGSGSTFVYMAIRRPHKPLDAFDPPLDGTDVFAIDTFGGTSPSPPAYTSGFPVDLAMFRKTSINNWELSSRLTRTKYILPAETGAESTDNNYKFDYQNGFYNSTSSDSTKYGWMFKRAPGFMDVVAYTGSTTFTQNVAHNLGVVPEMMIIKNRDASTNWVVYHTVVGATKFIRLNTDQDPSNSGGLAWNDTAPTASVFTLGNNGWDGTNYNGQKFIAYLFATLPGISKVGSYSGTGNAINVDCGFTNGARFILIKRTAGSSDWYVWDTARGIVSGNDPYLLLNSYAPQVTNTDYIDPLSTGFTVTSSAPSALNASGGTYLFLAIA